MSYSTTAIGATVAAAMAALSVQMDAIVEAQPIHANDVAQALAATKAMADLLPVDETRNVRVSVNGWLQWTDNEDSSPSFVHANVSATASLVAKE